MILPLLTPKSGRRIPFSFVKNRHSWSLLGLGMCALAMPVVAQNYAPPEIERPSPQKAKPEPRPNPSLEDKAKVQAALKAKEDADAKSHGLEKRLSGAEKEIAQTKKAHAKAEQGKQQLADDLAKAERDKQQLANKLAAAEAALRKQQTPAPQSKAAATKDVQLDTAESKKPSRPTDVIAKWLAQEGGWMSLGKPLQQPITLASGQKVAGPAMLAIPPTGPQGFMMGSPESESGRDGDEKQHKAVINYPFSLSQTEVTFAQWDQCVNDGGCSHTPSDSGWGRGQRPVINVSFDDIKSYLDWLNTKSGYMQKQGDQNVHPQRYRLPSETEWEWAARAKNTGPFGFVGKANIGPTLARYRWSESYQGSATANWEDSTMPVASYPANAWGLNDMHGNVWEWVGDCYESDYAKTAPHNGAAYQEDNAGCYKHVLRGGAWAYRPGMLRAAYRLDSPAKRDSAIGFRLARILAL